MGQSGVHAGSLPAILKQQLNCTLLFAPVLRGPLFPSTLEGSGSPVFYPYFRGWGLAWAL
jgi:hypothetical protein